MVHVFAHVRFFANQVYERQTGEQHFQQQKMAVEGLIPSISNPVFLLLYYCYRTSL